MALHLELDSLPREVQHPFEQIALKFPLGPEDLANGAVTDVKLATRIIRGEIAVGATVARGTGFTVFRTGGAPVGCYTVQFNTAFSVTPIVVVTTGAWNVGVIVTQLDELNAPSAADFKVRIRTGAGVLTDNVFTFIAISV